MTDLLIVLPDFPIRQYANLIPTLERHQVTTSDLLTLDVADIGRRTHLPLLDLKRLCNAVLRSLHCDLGVAPGPQEPPLREKTSTAQAETTLRSLAAQWQTISTLDPALDHALGGGVPAGCVTEVTGESGAGKTQFLLSLLLAVQLPPPHGLGRRALYISTEAALPTRRLAQILSGNPLLRAAAPHHVSLDNITSATTPDLESQDHILTFQAPVEIARRDVGLLVLDSVAANFRAEFDRAGPASGNMAARSAELLRLGTLLRDLARRHRLAVVVANQVADRFPAGDGPDPSRPLAPPPPSSVAPPATQESPLASRGLPAPEPPQLPSSSAPEPPWTPQQPGGGGHQQQQQQQQQQHHPVLLLDHQQRWFTGWGDEPGGGEGPLKTPSLGLVWSTQLAARVVLLRQPAWRRRKGEGGGWRRWMRVVFAPHVAGTGPGSEGAVEFEITGGGLRGWDKRPRTEATGDARG